MPFACLLCAVLSTPVGAEDAITVPEGFVVEQLYSVPPEQGSWGALCFGPDGSAYVSAEHGPLYRIELGATPFSPRVEALELPIDAVQGLCTERRSGALYALVSGSERFASGLYRLTDTDDDERLDRVECLRAFESGSEHGLHSLVLGPEPALYITSGVGAAPPAEALAEWGPSFLPVGRLPVAVQSVALSGEPAPRFPSGWIARTDLDGQDWDLVAVGLREPRDLAFWDLDWPCTLDSGAPSDAGLPWQAPTRFLPLSERADFGFRHGSACWPSWFPDAIPSTLELGPCEPAGMEWDLAGFPDPWARALFVGDRRGGHILAFHRPLGETPWREEVFAQGKPLSVADLARGPDGALYFCTGGGGSSSTFFRIRWTGRPAAGRGGSFSLLATGFQLQQARFEEDPASAGRTLASEDLPDSFQCTTRMALESIQLERWIELVDSEPDPRARATFELACARVAPPERVRALLERLAARPIDPVERALALATLRTLELALLRAAPVEPTTRARLAESLLTLIPANDPDLDRQLGVLLASLPEAAARFVPEAVRRAVRGTDPAAAFAWAFLVRRSTEGWTPLARRQLFNWLYTAELTFGGGRAAPLYLAALREDLSAGLTAEERDDLGGLASPPPELDATYSSARHFVQAWSVEALTPDLADLVTRDPENGRALLAEARCLACHRVEGLGGTSGPELLGLGARYRPAELLERLLHPSRAGDPRWRDTILTTRDGQRHVGRVVGGDAKALLLSQRYDTQALARIPRASLDSEELSPLSPMPEGLLDVLTRDEVLDLLAFLLREE